MPGLIEAIVATWCGAVSSASRSVKCIVVREARDRAEGAAKSMLAVEKSPVEVTLPPLGPVDPPLPGYRAVHQRDDALGEPGQLVGLEVRPERQAGNVEVRVAGIGRQPMLDADVGDERAARRVTERARRAHVIAGRW